jgi:hypothetical protein
VADSSDRGAQRNGPFGHNNYKLTCHTLSAKGNRVKNDKELTMIDINKNYPISIFNSTETLAVIANGDGDGQTVVQFRFRETGRIMMATFPAHVDSREVLQEIFDNFTNVQAYDVPPGLTPEEFLAWGVEEDLFVVTEMGMIQ